MNAKRLTLSASTLVGDKVINHAGEDLGSVKEIMLDVVNKTVAYVVVSVGGLFGLGDKLFAIPFERFEVDENKKAFVLNVSKEQLNSAPGFDKDNWPDFASENWSTRVQDYYKDL